MNEVENHFDYSRADQQSLHTGQAINMGDYPNVVKMNTTSGSHLNCDLFAQVESYQPFLPLLRQRLRLRPKFRDTAQVMVMEALLLLVIIMIPERIT